MSVAKFSCFQRLYLPSLAKGEGQVAWANFPVAELLPHCLDSL